MRSKKSMLIWLTPSYDLKVFTALGTYRICNNLLKLLSNSIEQDAFTYEKNTEIFLACFSQYLLGKVIRRSIKLTTQTNSKQ